MSAAPKSRLGRGLGGLIAAAKPVATASASVRLPPTAGLIAGFRRGEERSGRTRGTRRRRPALRATSRFLSARSSRAPIRRVARSRAEQLRELADSIRSEGLLQPIVVRKTGDKYQLIAGERRWRAFQLLKIKAIPARIVEASNASSAALGLIENLQREGLNPIEEAHGYASLIRDFDLTQESAAERVGKGRASVANSLRLLSLDHRICRATWRRIF